MGEVKSDFSCENETYALEVNSPAVASFQETDCRAHTESVYTFEFLLDLWKSLKLFCYFKLNLNRMQLVLCCVQPVKIWQHRRVYSFYYEECHYNTIDSGNTNVINTMHMWRPFLFTVNSFLLMSTGLNHLKCKNLFQDKISDCCELKCPQALCTECHCNLFCSIWHHYSMSLYALNQL